MFPWPRESGANMRPSRTRWRNYPAHAHRGTRLRERTSVTVPLDRGTSRSVATSDTFRRRMSARSGLDQHRSVGSRRHDRIVTTSSVNVPSGRADPNDRRRSLRAVRGNPSSGRIERSSPPVDSTASRNGYPQRNGSVGPCWSGRAEVVNGRSVQRSAVCARRSPRLDGLPHGPTEPLQLRRNSTRRRRGSPEGRSDLEHNRCRNAYTNWVEREKIR